MKLTKVQRKALQKLLLAKGTNGDWIELGPASGARLVALGLASKRTFDHSSGVLRKDQRTGRIHSSLTIRMVTRYRITDAGVVTLASGPIPVG